MEEVLLLDPLLGARQATIDEPWALDPVPGHVYSAAAEFAVGELGAGHGRRCLVIGSPLFEAQRLEKAGWAVSYVDVRYSPRIVRHHIVGDAVRLPFASQSFDAVSTTCVLCHVGLGRYGDPVETRGDLLALGEIARVTKPCAVAVVMFGPTFPGLVRSVRFGQEHRVYCLGEVAEAVAEAGLTSVVSRLWCRGKWMTDLEIASRIELDRLLSVVPLSVVPYSYLAMRLEHTQ